MFIIKIEHVTLSTIKQLKLQALTVSLNLPGSQLRKRGPLQSAIYDHSLDQGDYGSSRQGKAAIFVTGFAFATGFVNANTPLIPLETRLECTALGLHYLLRHQLDK